MDNRVKYLIFLDIDGTIIDSKYRSNSSDLASLILELQQSGEYIFLLNSNRSLEDIQSVASQFNINGMLICENGAFVYNQINKNTTVILDEENANLMRKFKSEYPQYLQKAANILGYEFDYKLVDTVKYVSEESNDTAINTYAENTVYVLDNIYRKYTISSHIREYNNGHVVNNKLLQNLSSEMEKLISSSEYHEMIISSYSNTFGNLLFYSTCTSKAMGVDFVRKLYLNSRVIAIGDEKSDAEMIGGQGEFWTVANASDEAKEMTSIVSTKTHTEGVYELLRRFTDEHTKSQP